MRCIQRAAAHRRSPQASCPVGVASSSSRFPLLAPVRLVHGRWQAPPCEGGSMRAGALPGPEESPCPARQADRRARPRPAAARSPDAISQAVVPLRMFPEGFGAMRTETCVVWALPPLDTTRCPRARGLLWGRDRNLTRPRGTSRGRCIAAGGPSHSGRARQQSWDTLSQHLAIGPLWGWLRDSSTDTWPWSRGRRRGGGSWRAVLPAMPRARRVAPDS